jgi:hypothetical protein
MTEKPFWISRIEKAWEEASIVWLAGDDDSGEGIRKAGLNRGKGHGSRVRELLEWQPTAIVQASPCLRD